MAITKPLIALVDDDQSILKSLARLLRLSGYTVNAFGSAPEFLGSLATGLPQCLVADVEMPGMNGFELEAKLRALGHRVPVVFITAHDTPQNRASATKTQAFDLLIKPFEPAALLALLQKAAPRGDGV